jgi:hypothetical protein
MPVGWLSREDFSSMLLTTGIRSRRGRVVACSSSSSAEKTTGPRTQTGMSNRVLRFTVVLVACIARSNALVDRDDSSIIKHWPALIGSNVRSYFHVYTRQLGVGTPTTILLHFQRIGRTSYAQGP